MTWPDFFKWLTDNGFLHTRGDIHYAGRGYWFPALPDITTGAENPRPPEPWVHISEDRANKAVFIDRASGGTESAYAESPEDAKVATERELMVVYRAMDEALGDFGDFGAPTRGGGIYRFIQMWAEGTLGRKTKEASVSVRTNGPVVTLYSYAVPIASIFDRSYVIVSGQRALERTSLTTNAHLRVVENVIRESPFLKEQSATLTEGRIPEDAHDWEGILVSFDARNEGRPGRLRGHR